MSNIDEKKKYFEHIKSKISNMPSFNDIEKHIFRLFHKKYFTSKRSYEKLITNNIIYNEKTHIVARFKEYLVIDDLSEFLKRFYKKKESVLRLPLYFDYYQTYSKIFPNYTVLKESKYIYKNIHRKQKMIDLQQEEESEELKRQKEKKELKHQRKKNKQEINTIFDNDVYNSIIKQSQDLYMILFGIEKNNNKNNNNNKNEEVQNSFTSFDIKNIVNSIEKYDYDSKIGFNYKNNLIIPKIYKNVNSKKYIKKVNNSSLLTKQSTFNSSNLYSKIKNIDKFYKNNDDIIVGLKKIKNEKKSTNSNSLLMSQKMNKKNIFIKGHLKSLTSSKFLMDFKENSKSKSKSKSKNKENKKRSKIKVNQKILIDDKYNNLTDRTLVNGRYKNLKKDIFCNSTTANNSKIKSKLLNKKSTDFNYYTRMNSINNSNIFRHTRINTNDNINNITDSSKYKTYKTRLLNRTKAKNFIEYNNKLKINLKKMREIIKKNKITDKLYYTERCSVTPTHKHKEKKIDKLQKNKFIDNIKSNIIKKINTHKKSVPSIDIKTKINKNILLSNRITSSSKINKLNFKSNFLSLPFKENFKINKNQIKQMCNRKISNNMDKTEDRNFYSERGSVQYASKKNCQEKMKLNIPNEFSVLKKVEFKYYNTTTNSKSKEKIKYNIKEKGNNLKNNHQAKKIKKIYKQKKKEISPIKYNIDNTFNNTERNRKYINVKILLKKIKK